MATLRVLVTRPAAQAAAWVRRLHDAGVDAQALPLIAIDPVLDAAPLRAAWHSLQQRALVMFVSPNAVAGFFAARPAALHWPQGVRAAAPGPGTVDALVAAGVPRPLCVAPTAPPYEAAALWPSLRHERWTDRSVLVLRGDGGREDFAQQLRDAGASVDFVQAYRRHAPAWSTAEAACADAALAAPTQHVWLLSSGEAIGHLTTLRPQARWQSSIALATHPRIAERARQAGFGRVLEAAPTNDAVLAALRSLESTPS